MLGMLAIVVVVSVVVMLRRSPLPTPRWWLLGLGATALQVVPYYGHGHDWLLRVSYGLLLLVAWHNRDRIGGRLLLAGLACNALPIMVYGRMPIAAAMLQHFGWNVAAGTILHASKDVVLDASPLLLLSDSIPVNVLGYRAA